MTKKAAGFSIASVRFQIWKQIILAVLLVSAVAFLYDGYRRTRISSLESYSAQHTIHANQIINEIQFRFELIRNVLDLWSKSTEIMHLSDETTQCMERILEAHGSYISGVTRMDETGVIWHSVPYYEGAAGADISQQEHIQVLLETHQPVLSDAFMTIQEYWAIAYHTPCFSKDGSFKGSLAFLVPFREMLRYLFMQLLPGEDIIPLVLGNHGLVLFSPNASHEGMHYTEAFSADSGLLEIADAAYTGRAGYMLTDFVTFTNDQDEPRTMLSTIVPFGFQGTTWTLILSVPESVVMEDISGMSNRWLGGMLAIILLAIIYSTLKVRVWIASREEKKWVDVAQLKDVLISTIDQADEVFIILDTNERILYANKAVEKLFGISREYIGQKISRIPLQGLDLDMCMIRKQVLKSGTWSGMIKSSKADAPSRDLDTIVSSIKVPNGELTNFIIIARDVTVQMEMERRLLQQQKMEAIGQLAGGIAHDFNNLLVGILGYAELLKGRYSEDPDIEKSADIIIAAVHQGSELTKQLLGYARMGKHLHSRIDVRQCVLKVNRLLKRTLDRRIEVELDLEEGVYISGDASQIEQVILNLAVNARDAMPEGGKLKFILRKGDASTSIIGGNADESMQLAVLKAADTGCGISDEYIERIFEPFFTTKDEEGTGMGLATVYGIVVNHGGWIDVDSLPGSGTEFTIFIPIDSAEGPEVEMTHTLDIIPDGKAKRILIVDDEFLVAATLTELLTEMGYMVTSASGGERAVELFTENPNAFKVVILDLSMPEMDGRECFLRLREVDPGVKVILATGFSRDGRVQELLDMGVMAFLQKPFRLQELAAILTDLIG